MIELRLSLQASPRQIKSLRDAFQSLARLARLARGCLEAHVFTESPGVRNLCYTEVWDTEDHLCAMLRSEHFTALVELMEQAVAPPTLDFRTISVVHDLNFAWQVRQDQPCFKPMESEDSP